MEELYKSLIKSGKTATVDSVIQWMKDAKIIDGVKMTEDNARQLFTGIANNENIGLDTFKEAMTKIASDQKKNIEDFIENVAKGAGGGIPDALKTGASAFTGALPTTENSESSMPLRSVCDSDEVM